MAFEKANKARVLRALVLGACFLQGSVQAGVPEILNQLNLRWERKFFGATQVPVYEVQPCAEEPNRNHWDDLVAHPEERPEEPGWRGIVNHYTVCDFVRTVQLFTADKPDNRVSAHFVITEKDEKLSIDGGEIVHVVPLKSRAWHGGVSGWADINGAGLKGVNACFLGIEHVNQGFKDEGHGRQYFSYDPNQITASIALSRELLAQYPLIAPTHVVGHDDITERKQDPGPLFPWEAFYQKGVGAYLTPGEFEGSMVPYWSVKEPLPQGLSVEFQLSYMARYGYDLDPAALLTPKNRALIEAFRGHFSCNMRPQEVPLSDEKLTREDMAWISGLVAKYRS